MKLQTNNKIPFILIGVSIFMIIVGCISSLIIGLNEDKKMTNLRMNDVNLEYEDYSTMVSIFEEERDALYGNVLNKITYDNMYTNNKYIKNKLFNY